MKNSRRKQLAVTLTFAIVAFFAVFSTTFALTFTRTLTIGARGVDVKELQTILIAQGDATGAPTGYFGPLTAAALKQFQNDHGISAVGSVGPKTLAVLNALDTTSSSKSTLIAALMAQVKVLEAQIAAILAGQNTTAVPAGGSGGGSSATITNYTPPPPASGSSGGGSSSGSSSSGGSNGGGSSGGSSGGSTPPADTTPPSVTITAPSGNLAVNTTSTTLSVTTSEAASCAYSTNSGAAFAAMSVFATTGATAHTTILSGLQNSISYTYYVKCKDTAGNISGNASVAFSVSAPAVDVTPPSVPTNLAAIAASASQINLSWTASTDNVAVTGYKVYRNNVLLASPSTANYSDSGLTASTQYSYVVKATDAAGNLSASSTAATATTQASGGGGGGGNPNDPTYTKPLDSWSGATAAYSLRKLRSPYNGFAVKVRRSSDNTTQDIGFTANGNFDINSFNTFVGAGSGYVVKWYDQSGNGNDLVQNTPSKQFQLIANGSPSSQPVLRGSSTSGMSAADSATYKTSNIHVFVVAKLQQTAAQDGDAWLIGYPQSAGVPFSTGYPPNPDVWFIGHVFGDSFFPIIASDWQENWEGFGTAYKDRLYQFEFDTTGGTIRMNNLVWEQMSGHGPLSYPNPVGLYVGMDGSGALSLPGDFAEIILYGSTQAQHASITSNQTGYWGVTDPPASITTSDGFTWAPVYSGDYNSSAGPNQGKQILINGRHYFTESAWDNNSLWIDTDPGTTMVRFQVNQGDNWQSSERSELDGAADTWLLDHTYEISYAVKVEPGQPITNAAWEALGQFHTGSGGSTCCTFSFPFQNDKFSVAEDAGGTVYTTPTITRDQWYYFFVKTKVSSNHSGDSLQVWINGQQVVNHSGNLFPNDGGSPGYWKFGVYRGWQGSIPQSLAVRYANMKVVDITASPGADISSEIASPPTAPGANGTTPVPTCSLTTSPTTITTGQSSALSWSSTNGSSASISSIGTVALSGSQSVSPTTGTTTSSTSYTLTVSGQFGSATCNATVTVNPLADTQAPTTPSNLSATAISFAQVNLSWSASSDNYAVAGYQIYRNGAQVGTTNSTSYSDLGLSGNTTYTYTVKAYDTSNNVSSASNSASATTTSPPQSCAQANQFLARIPAQDASHTTAYDTLICGLVSDGLWSKLDILYIFAAADQQSALTNLMSGTYSASNVGAITFTPNSGFSNGGNSKGIDLGWSPANGTNYTQYSASFGAWDLDNNSYWPGIISSDVGGLAPRTPHNSVGNASGSDTEANFDSPGWSQVAIAPVANAAGWWSIDRFGNNTVNPNTQIYFDGASDGAAGGIGYDAWPSTQHMFASYSSDNNGAPPSAAAYAGADLTAAQHLQLYNRIRAYMQAIAGLP